MARSELLQLLWLTAGIVACPPEYCKPGASSRYSCRLARSSHDVRYRFRCGSLRQQCCGCKSRSKNALDQQARFTRAVARVHTSMKPQLGSAWKLEHACNVLEAGPKGVQERFQSVPLAMFL